VKNRVEESSVRTERGTNYSRLEPSVYLGDGGEFPEADSQYVPVPPKSVTIVRARCGFAGKRPPAEYPIE
jgi:hypothetical protein